MSFIITADVSVRLLRDAVLPPLSSKVLKYLVETRCANIKSVVDVKKPFKPLQISMLVKGGRPLYRSGDVEGEVINLRAGTCLKGRISFAGSYEGRDPLNEFQGLIGIIESPYGEFQIDVLSIEFRKLESLSLGLTKFFKIEFVTPAVLTAKHMVPPPLRDKSRKLPERHRLLPQPSFIFSYLLKLWNSIAEPDERIPGPGAGDWEAYKLGRLADVTLVEVDYRLRPETVVVGRDSRGRLRRVRGFTGWVVYECLSRRLLPIYDKLLALATYLGVGRSRGIGLGMVRVTGLSSRGPESSE